MFYPFGCKQINMPKSDQLYQFSEVKEETLMQFYEVMLQPSGES